MKHLITLTAVLICSFSYAQRLEMPTAKFNTGDTIAYSYPAYIDESWMTMRSNLNWDKQGMPLYDGFGWYRFHVFVPLTLKTNSYWKDSIRIYLGKVDDACEVYLNGTLIGKSGSFPDEKGGYKTTWNRTLEFHIAANTPYFKWGGENLIALRVYDGGGLGGQFGGVPFLDMVDLIDGISIHNEAPAQFMSQTKMKKTVSLVNSLKIPVSGVLHYQVMDVEKRTETNDSVKVNIKTGAKFSYTIPVTMTGRNNIRYMFTESRSGKSTELTEVLPYILTPPAPEEPRINGARMVGVRPNSPFLFKIPATGKKPLAYSVENLPEGLKINPANGVISGVIKEPKEIRLMLVVKNSLGTDKKELTVRCGDLLALTPPMGWNSWNCWGLSVSDEKLKASAKAMMDKGLIDHGWTYMNIDDGWEAAARNAKGEIVANAKFPDMKKLGDWLHDNGLKFGIYSSPGTKTCGGYLGSYQHEEQDAATYARWGIDYLKYDWCSYDDIHDKKDSSMAAYMKPYKVMQEALAKQNRDIVYSLCQYGMKNVWEWGPMVNGNCWRTTGDIEDSWESLYNIGFSQVAQAPYSSPGRWNDPDMMIVGQVGWGENLHPTRLSPDEQYTHVSLWSLLDAPLLIGCDLSKLDDFTLNLLTNDEVIAVNQDPLGKQAQQLMVTNEFQVWVKDLSDGTKAIGIFNISNKDDVPRFYWNNLRLGDNYKVRDLWRQKDLGRFRSMFATKVPAHGVTLIKIEPFTP